MLEVVLDPSGFPFWFILCGIIAGVGVVMARPLLVFSKFVYPNAKFEAIGTPFIHEKDVMTLTESKSLDGFVESLNTVSSDYHVEGDTAFDVQQSLDQQFVKMVRMMQKDSHKSMSSFFEAYLTKYDIPVLKTELKKLLLGNKSEVNGENAVLPRTRRLIERFADVDEERILSIVKEEGLPEEIATVFIEGKKDIVTLDVALDRYMMQALSEVKMPYKSSEARDELVEMMKDMLNLRNLLRAKQLGVSSEQACLMRVGEGREYAKWKLDELAETDSVPQLISALEGSSWFDALKESIEEYHREQSVQVFEDAVDRAFLTHVRDIAMRYYIGVGPTLRFLIGKEFETRNLKVIAKGVAEKVPQDAIKSLLIMEVQVA